MHLVSNGGQANGDFLYFCVTEKRSQVLAGTDHLDLFQSYFYTCAKS